MKTKLHGLLIATALFLTLSVAVFADEPPKKEERRNLPSPLRPSEMYPPPPKPTCPSDRIFSGKLVQPNPYSGYQYWQGQCDRK